MITILLDCLLLVQRWLVVADKVVVVLVDLEMVVVVQLEVQAVADMVKRQ